MTWLAWDNHLSEHPTTASPKKERTLNIQKLTGTAAAFLTLAVSAANVAHAQNDWEYSIKPYGWYVWYDGSTGADGSAPVESDSSLMDMLDGFFLIHGEARRGKLSLLGEFNWVDMSDDLGGPLGNQPVSWDLEGYMVALGAAYAVFEQADTRVEIMGGIRHWDVEVETEVFRRAATADTTITDPFIGMRFETPISERISLHGAAAFGAGGDSDEQFDVAAEFRWQWTERTDLALGARYLRLNFDKDAVLVDASLYGPYLAVNFRF